MNLMQTKALEVNPNVRNLESAEALDNLMSARVVILELFQSPAGQLLVEYLLALADRSKDDFFDSKDGITDYAKGYLKGQLDTLAEVVDVGLIVKRYKSNKT